MFDAALSGSVLILVVLCIRLVCRGKISARFQYAFWLLVLVRLLLPVSLGASSFSVLNAVPEQTSAPFTPSPRGQAGTGADWTGDLEYPQPQDVFIPQPGQSPTTQSTPGSPQEPAQAKAHWTLGNWLNLVWLLGALAVGLVFVVENLVCARRLRRGRVPFQGEKSGCPLPVYVAEGLPSPCLFGVVHPAIYLTPGAAADEEAVPYILAHEGTHFRHLDHVWPIFRALAVALYWWNPLVWLAAHCSRVDCELACDEGALKVLGEELRFEYGRTLVGLVPVKKAPSGLFRAATTMTGGKKELKQRLDIILKRPKTVLPLLVCAVLVAAAAVGCTFTGAEKEEVSPTQDSAPDMSGQEVHDVGEPSAVLDGMEAAIHQSILDYNRGRYQEGEFACESHEVLSTALVTDPDDPEGRPLVKVLAMVLYQEYNYQRVEYDVMAAGFEAVSGGHVPTVLTFRETEDGGYTLTGYWEPGDGEGYGADLEQMCEEYFPDLALNMLDTQKYIEVQDRSCYAQAIQYGQVAAWSIVEELVDQYVSMYEEKYHSLIPQAEERPGTEDLNLVRRELLRYGDYALTYAFSQFLQEEQYGARGQILFDAMKELLGEEADRFDAPLIPGLADDINYQRYFDEWLERAVWARDVHNEEFQAEMPKTRMLFSLVGSQAIQNVKNNGWHLDGASGPIQAVRSEIERWRQEDYAVSVEVKEIQVDLDETARVAEYYFGSQLAQARGWTYDTFVNHFVVVKAQYEAEYDHTKTFQTDGSLVQDFWLVQDGNTGAWSIAETAAPVEDPGQAS